MALQNERDLQYHPSRESRSSFDHVENRDPLATVARTTQQQVQPAGIKQHGLKIITVDPQTFTLGVGDQSPSFTIPDSSSRTLNITYPATSPVGQTTLVATDVTPYVASGDSAPSIVSTNIWPNATYNMTNLTMSVYNNWSRSDNINTVTSVGFWNHSGGDVTVIVLYRVRAIFSSQATSAGGSAG